MFGEAKHTHRCEFKGSLTRTYRFISLFIIGSLVNAVVTSHFLVQTENEALRQVAFRLHQAATSCRGHMEDSSHPIPAAFRPYCPCGCSRPTSPATPATPLGVGIPGKKADVRIPEAPQLLARAPLRITDVAALSVDHIPISA